MKTIIFDSPFDRDTFLRNNRVFWNYSWKKAGKQIRISLIISIILLGLGLLTRTNDESGNPFIFVSVFLLCGSALMGLLMFSSWRRYNRIIKEVADEYERINSDLIFEITEDTLNFKDFQKQLELRWSVFKHYTIYRGYIIIIPKYFISGAFLFDKNDKFEADKCEEVLKILKDKLKYIKS